MKRSRLAESQLERFKQYISTPNPANAIPDPGKSFCMPATINPASDKPLPIPDSKKPAVNTQSHDFSVFSSDPSLADCKTGDVGYDIYIERGPVGQENIYTAHVRWPRITGTGLVDEATMVYRLYPDALPVVIIPPSPPKPISWSALGNFYSLCTISKDGSPRPAACHKEGSAAYSFSGGNEGWSPYKLTYNTVITGPSFLPGGNYELTLNYRNKNEGREVPPPAYPYYNINIYINGSATPTKFVQLPVDPAGLPRTLDKIVLAGLPDPVETISVEWTNDLNLDPQPYDANFQLNSIRLDKK